MPQASYCGPPKSSLLHHPDTRCRCVFFFLSSNQGDCADLLWLVRPSFPFSSSVRHIFVRYSMSQSVARSAWSRARGRGNEQAPPLPSSLARERPLLPSTAMRRGEGRSPGPVRYRFFDSHSCARLQCHTGRETWLTGNGTGSSARPPTNRPHILHKVVSPECSRDNQVLPPSILSPPCYHTSKRRGKLTKRVQTTSSGIFYIGSRSSYCPSYMFVSPLHWCLTSSNNRCRLQEQNHNTFQWGRLTIPFVLRWLYQETCQREE